MSYLYSVQYLTDEQIQCCLFSSTTIHFYGVTIVAVVVLWLINKIKKLIPFVSPPWPVALSCVSILANYAIACDLWEWRHDAHLRLPFRFQGCFFEFNIWPTDAKLYLQVSMPFFCATSFLVPWLNLWLVRSANRILDVHFPSNVSPCWSLMPSCV